MKADLLPVAVPTDTLAPTLFDHVGEGGFMADNPYYSTELRVPSYGVEGEPLPYMLRRDSFVTGTLLLSFFFVAFLLARLLRVIGPQYRNLFYFRERGKKSAVVETEHPNRWVTFILTSFMAAVIFLRYTQETMPDLFGMASPYILLALNFTVVLTYCVGTDAACRLVNWTFFSADQREQWTAVSYLIGLTRAILLFLLALLIVYFNLSTQYSNSLFVLVIVLCVLLGLAKSRQIFFNYPLAHIHLFLYFCSLELIPLYLTWAAINKTTALVVQFF